MELLFIVITATLKHINSQRTAAQLALHYKILKESKQLWGYYYLGLSAILRFRGQSVASFFSSIKTYKINLYTFRGLIRGERFGNTLVMSVLSHYLGYPIMFVCNLGQEIHYSEKDGRSPDYARFGLPNEFPKQHYSGNYKRDKTTAKLD